MKYFALFLVILGSFISCVTPSKIPTQKIIEKFEMLLDRVAVKKAEGVVITYSKDSTRVYLNAEGLQLDTFQVIDQKTVAEFLTKIKFSGQPLNTMSGAPVGSQQWILDTRDYFVEQINIQGKDVKRNLITIFLNNEYQALALKLPMDNKPAGMRFFEIPKPKE